ncbi:hypothetical protein FRX31_021790 [Thalictrum thalictroides]|uniref:RNase H type-1 domain-containing protein n=1 Tax=Thalictrum thalictroides TaxID=46969 RepID=A0A7J6VU53_THATH|nr:hypothetical protein FRX31_021790 [Thalictrum thalictroides]
MGIFVSAGCQRNGATLAECKGLLSATRWCLELQVTRLELETECKGAADFLNGLQANLSWCHFARTST